MIIHKLILHGMRHRDDQAFYEMQAQDAIAWLERQGVETRPGRSALDLGCGHGVFGGELMKRGCSVTFADAANYLLPTVASTLFRAIDLDREDPAGLGAYDLVICSNVLEHLAKPEAFLSRITPLVRSGGHFYLSWTNWLSPWGGHEFSPLHYFGAEIGMRCYDRLSRRKRFHTAYVNLFPTYIGAVLAHLRKLPGLHIVKLAPRYYPEFGWIMKVPGLREFLAWNCAVLMQRY